MEPIVKQELPDPPPLRSAEAGGPVGVIDLSSSDSESEVEDADGALGKRFRVSNGGGGGSSKKQKGDDLPLGFLDPLPSQEEAIPAASAAPVVRAAVAGGSKQFWKAGDYDRDPVVDPLPSTVAAGMDHVRVHPKFLHSNATSHKWALGAFAELLDNSLDEVGNGATFVNIDMIHNKKDGTKMLLIEDNGGGMNPDKMRQCISLGYSVKSRIANTIGQYGNGFKTSTMRLGADVIVFSRSLGKDDKSSTQSIGMLSYTFLRDTGKEDIVVPMLDYERTGQVWHKMTRASVIDWNVNVKTIIQWSPYSSEADLLQQFNSMSEQGTRIVIYNLWEDDQGELELDFSADKHDIQLGGVNRDEKKIEMASQFPNSRHFLTYRHSLRSYASILYLRLPTTFRMILRGKEIEHHNIVNDMMLKEKVTYRPQAGPDGVSRDLNAVAVVTIGFVKDAKHHIDVQGFNVYHKNRLIKPFWRVWSAAGSDGRGVIGVLEANFVEPAHDKQGFERTTVLARLETKLVQMQKTYWTTNCHKIGYAPRRNKALIQSENKETSPEAPSVSPSSRRLSFGKNVFQSSEPLSQYSDKSFSNSNKSGKPSSSPYESAKSGNRSGKVPGPTENWRKSTDKFENLKRSEQSRLQGSPLSYGSDSDGEYHPTRSVSGGSGGSKALPPKLFLKESGLSTSPYSVNKRAAGNSFSDGRVGNDRIATRSQSKAASVTCNGNESINEEPELSIKQLKDENEALKARITNMEETMLHELQQERERNKLLTEQLEAAEKKVDVATKEQEALIDIFSEERSRRDREEENLRKKLKDASLTIQELLEKLRSKPQ
ncbi:protein MICRORCHIDIA 4-like [Iris pallida]|uniref:Protein MICRORCHIDIA 4-like n=1 Tax=Iris pallida TaxID=29817 RepID=A0AAX6HZM0_IRIPA|nr:protein MICRORCHIDIA 4-like [Iris pallida]